MRQTTNYGLKMPEGSDTVNIDDLNYNTGIIDQKLKDVENKTSNIKVPVESVNGKTGKVELKAVDIKTGDGKSVESHLADTTKIIGNINDTSLDSNLKGKSLTEMAKLLFQNANSIKTKIADAIGSSFLKDNTGEEIANYIREEKKRLCLFSFLKFNISVSENNSLHEMITIFFENMENHMEKNFVLFDKEQNNNYIFRDNSYIYKFINSIDDSFFCLEIYNSINKSLIKKLTIGTIRINDSYDYYKTILYAMPCNNHYCYILNSKAGRKHNDDTRYYDYKVSCYYLNDTNSNSKILEFNNRSFFQPFLITDKEFLYVLYNKDSKYIIEKYKESTLISSYIICNYDTYHGLEKEVTSNTKYIFCYSYRESDIHILTKNLTFQERIHTSCPWSCTCNEDYLYIHVDNQITQYSLNDFKPIKTINLKSLFSDTIVKTEFFNSSSCSLLSADEKKIYIRYENQIFTFDMKDLSFKSLSLYYHDKNKNIYKDTENNIYID